MNLKETIRTNEMHFLLLFLSGAFLVMASALHYSISWISLDLEFGLLQMLPLSAWIGLALMTVCALVGIQTDSEKVFIAKAFLLFFIIWSLPVFFESNVSSWDSFFHFNTTREIIKSSYLKELGGSTYLAWPGFFLYNNALFNLVGLPVLEYLKYYRLFSVTITFFAFLVFLKKIIPKNYRITIILFTFFLVWINNFHNSPQSIGLALLLLTLSTLFFKRMAFWFLGFLFIVWLLVSHPTTMSIAIAITMVWIATSFIYWFLIAERAPAKFFSHPLSIVLVMLIFFTSIFFFNEYLAKQVEIGPPANTAPDAGKQEQSSGLITEVIKRAGYDINPTQESPAAVFLYKQWIEKRLGIDTKILIKPDGDTNDAFLPKDSNAILERAKTDENFAKRLSIEPVLSLAPKIRIFALLSMSLLAILYLFSWFWIKDRSEKNTYLFLFSCIMTIFLLIEFGPKFLVRLSEFMDRIVMYASIFFTIMAVLLSSVLPPKFGRILIAIMFGLAIINFSTSYSSEALIVVGDQIKEASLFVERFAAPNDAKIWAPMLPYIPHPNQEYRSRAFVDAWVYSTLPNNWKNWFVFSDYDLIWDRRWGFVSWGREENIKYALTTNKLMENYHAQVFYSYKK